MMIKTFQNSNCPSCSNANSLRNSRPRKNLEKLIKSVTWFDLYRCKNCGWRGYKSNLRLTAKTLKTFLIYLLLMLVSAFIVSQILKKIS